MILFLFFNGKSRGNHGADRYFNGLDGIRVEPVTKDFGELWSIFGHTRPCYVSGYRREWTLSGDDMPDLSFAVSYRTPFPLVFVDRTRLELVWEKEGVEIVRSSR